MEMIDLIKRLDNRSDDMSDITADCLFAIPIRRHLNDKVDYGMTVKDVFEREMEDADRDGDYATQPGAFLLWEFNANAFEEVDEEIDFAKIETCPKDPATFNKVGKRMRRFVDLLERLDIGTRYDCWDGYGCQDERPEVAVIDHLCFEADDDFIFQVVMPLALAGGFFPSEKEFKEYCGIEEE